MSYYIYQSRQVSKKQRNNPNHSEHSLYLNYGKFWNVVFCPSLPQMQVLYLFRSLDSYLIFCQGWQAVHKRFLGEDIFFSQTAMNEQCNVPECRVKGSQVATANSQSSAHWHSCVVTSIVNSSSILIVSTILNNYAVFVPLCAR